MSLINKNQGSDLRFYVSYLSYQFLICKCYLLLTLSYNIQSCASVSASWLLQEKKMFQKRKSCGEKAQLSEAKGCQEQFRRELLSSEYCVSQSQGLYLNELRLDPVYENFPYIILYLLTKFQYQTFLTSQNIN